MKGVEAEINKMTSNYQKEIADLKHKHQYDIQNTLEEARINYETKETTIRDTYAKDREGAIERERQALQDRYEKQMKMEQMTFEQQRQRFVSEFSAERDRLYMEMKEKEEIYDNTKENLLKERSEMIEQVKRDYNEKLKIQEIKHQVKMLFIFRFLLLCFIYIFFCDSFIIYLYFIYILFSLFFSCQFHTIICFSSMVESIGLIFRFFFVAYVYFRYHFTGKIK